MPTYEYKCPVCGSCDEVVRPMSEAHLGLRCKGCDSQMARVYSFTFSVPVPHTGYFNYGLGIPVNSKSDIREFQKRYADTHGGNELIEVGNERPKVAPKRVGYDLPDGVV